MDRYRGANQPVIEMIIRIIQILAIDDCNLIEYYILVCRYVVIINVGLGSGQQVPLYPPA